MGLCEPLLVIFGSFDVENTIAENEGKGRTNGEDRGSQRTLPAEFLSHMNLRQGHRFVEGIDDLNHGFIFCRKIQIFQKNL